MDYQRFSTLLQKGHWPERNANVLAATNLSSNSKSGKFIQISCHEKNTCISFGPSIFASVENLLGKIRLDWR